jgi:alkylated DNA repair dioxygenase AlkB
MHYQSRSLNVCFLPQFLEVDLSFKIFDLCQELPWTYDQKHRRSNLTFGDPDLVYSVSFGDRSYCRTVRPWSEFPILEDLKGIVESSIEKIEVGGSKTKFNCCAIMRYPNNKIGIKRHRDKEMTTGTTICGLSFGATRTLKLYPPSYEKDSSDISLTLIPGSLYAMFPPTNDCWTHEIPPATFPSDAVPDTNEVRYSLTFRDMPIISNADSALLLPKPKKECQAVIKSGKRKGEKCGGNARNSDEKPENWRCGIHLRWMRK